MFHFRTIVNYSDKFKLFYHTDADIRLSKMLAKKSRSHLSLLRSIYMLQLTIPSLQHKLFDEYKYNIPL